MTVVPREERNGMIKRGKKRDREKWERRKGVSEYEVKDPTRHAEMICEEHTR